MVYTLLCKQLELSDETPDGKNKQLRRSILTEKKLLFPLRVNYIALYFCLVAGNLVERDIRRWLHFMNIIIPKKVDWVRHILILYRTSKTRLWLESVFNFEFNAPKFFELRWFLWIWHNKTWRMVGVWWQAFFILSTKSTNRWIAINFGTKCAAWASESLIMTIICTSVLS